MSRSTAALCGLVLILSACHMRGGADVDARTDYRMTLSDVGDTVVYLQRTQARSGVVQARGDTVVSRSTRAEVIDLFRVAPDTLVAAYEHMLVRVSAGDHMRPVNMQALRNQRFVLTEVDGRMRTVQEPEVPGMQAAVRSMSQQLEQLFLMHPEESLVTGFNWVDTVAVIEDQDEAHLERHSIVRYDVVGDTVLYDVPASVVRYESAVDVSLLSTAGRADSTRTRLQGGEEGTVIYSAGRDLVLAYARSGLISGEVVIVVNDTTQRVPHFYEFRTTVEILPSAADSAAAQSADEAAAS